MTNELVQISTIMVISGVQEYQRYEGNMYLFLWGSMRPDLATGCSWQYSFSVEGETMHWLSKAWNAELASTTPNSQQAQSVHVPQENR